MRAGSGSPPKRTPHRISTVSSEDWPRISPGWTPAVEGRPRGDRGAGGELRFGRFEGALDRFNRIVEREIDQFKIVGKLADSSICRLYM